MLAFKDETLAIDEPKNVRLEQRTKPHVKAQIQQAAALLGIDETAFVTTTAYERARAVIQDHQRTILTTEDAEAFLALLDNSAPVAKARRESAELHEQMVIDDEPDERTKG